MASISIKTTPFGTSVLACTASGGSTTLYYDESGGALGVGTRLYTDEALDPSTIFDGQDQWFLLDGGTVTYQIGPDGLIIDTDTCPVPTATPVPTAEPTATPVPTDRKSVV